MVLLYIANREGENAMPKWRWWYSLIIVIAVSLLVVGAGVWLVRQPAPQSVPNIEAAWNEAISRLGIDPVYPPEEDLVVGDLLASVISDNEPDPIETKDDKLKLHRDSPFLRRTVKIAHIDLSVCPKTY